MASRSRKHLIIGVGKVITALLGLIAIGLGLDIVFSLPSFRSLPALVGGLVVLATAVSLEAWGTFSLWASGEGTPNPSEPPRKLVTQGPYGVSRNPLYLARLVMLIAVSLVLGSSGILLVALGLFLTLHLVLLPREESRLAVKFGEEYHEYAGRVGRWIRPSVFRSDRNRAQ